MKSLASINHNQRGVGLVEALVSVALSSIVILGAAYATGKMLTSQQQSNLQYIVINELQARLQNATVEQKKSWCNKTEIPTILLPKEKDVTKIEVSCDDVNVTINNSANATHNRTISESQPVKFEVNSPLLGGKLTVGEALK